LKHERGIPQIVASARRQHGAVARPRGGNLPVAAAGVQLSMKGVVITAFWEKSRWGRNHIAVMGTGREQWLMYHYASC